MDTKNKFYWLWAAIGLLLFLNIATIGWVIRRVDTIRTNRQNPEAFIARRLGFTPKQVTKYQQSRKQMRGRVKPHEDSLRLLRGKLFSHIKQPVVSDEAMNRLLEQMARQNGQITRLRFRHWQQIRALCTPAQQARFDQLLDRLGQGISDLGQGGLRERFKNRFQ